MKKICLISSFLVIFDQIIKIIVRKLLNSVIIIPNFLSLVYVKNDGSAFNILSGMRLFTVLLSLFFIFYLFYEYKKTKKNEFIYSLLLGGIIGNLIDRIFLGFVTDYISIGSFPVFNLADICIVIGAILMIIISFYYDKKKVK